MKKPRILIAIHYMEIGGAEISLIGLLQSIDYSRIDVDLLVYSHRGELMQLIPSQVNLLPEIKKYTTTELPIKQVLMMGYPDVVVARLLAKFKYSRLRRRCPSTLPDDCGVYQYMANHVTPLLPKINPEVEYDLAVNFCGMQNVVLDKVRARRRAAWIHTDYSTLDTDRECDLRVWKRFDSIVSISPQVTAAFTKVYPSLSPKIVEIENMLSPEFVRSRAAAEDVSDEMPGNPTLLSVGRYCTAKNYDNLPDMARRLVNGGFPGLKWYIIGYGDDSLIRSRIQEAGMENHVILLGKKSNPYPYIKACDIYVQPSRYEGKSVTVREAQILGKPVVVTAYPTASSQIRDGIDGLIVPMDNEGCANGIARLISDVGMQNRIRLNLKKLDFGNMSEVEKFYRLVSE